MALRPPPTNGKTKPKAHAGLRRQLTKRSWGPSLSGPLRPGHAAGLEGDHDENPAEEVPGNARREARRDHQARSTDAGSGHGARYRRPPRRDGSRVERVPAVVHVPSARP